MDINFENVLKNTSDVNLDEAMSRDDLDIRNQDEKDEQTDRLREDTLNMMSGLIDDIAARGWHRNDVIEAVEYAVEFISIHEMDGTPDMDSDDGSPGTGERV